MCRLPGSKGFTLAELLLCLFILAVALLGLVTANVYAVRARRGSQRLVLATSLAVSYMTEIEETLRLSQDEFATSHRLERRPVPDYPGYFYAVDDPGLSPTLKAVIVSLYYPDGNGLPNREYPLRTVVRRPL